METKKCDQKKAFWTSGFGKKVYEKVIKKIHTDISQAYFSKVSDM